MSLSVGAQGVQLQVIHAFAAYVNGFPIEGASPQGALIFGSDGNLYGTTERGGAISNYNYGTVFRLGTNGSLTTLTSFFGAYGGQPMAGVIQASDGNLYGTANSGGDNSEGSVFQVTTNGTLTRIISFNNANGEYPSSSLVQGGDGNLYGTAFEGGGNCCGSVFKTTTGGAMTTLYSFSGSGSIGSALYAGVVFGNDGLLYGTTAGGGSSSYGTVFQLNTNGVLNTLVSFNGANGRSPESPLVLGSDGSFYGTTIAGGALTLGNGSGVGTVFKITTNGTFTNLAFFYGTNGAYANNALIQGRDGNFTARPPTGA